MIYPGKNNLILIAGSLILVGGVFFFAEITSPKNVGVYTPEIVANPTNKQLVEDIQLIDSDSDGLKDWEEVIWNTNPQKKDSDGDGILDGVEVEQGRNPSIAGAGPKVVTAQEEYAKLNQTEKFGRDIFAKYIELKQTGLIDDADSRAAVINELITSSAYTDIPKTYTSKDIIVISGIEANDTLALRNYANTVGGIFLANETKVRNETLIVKEALDKENPAILKELDPLIASYEKIIQALLKTPVPQKLGANHIFMINTVSELLFISEAFKNVFTNPLIALQAIGRYPKAFENFTESSLVIKRQFHAAGISFEQTEGGYFFGPVLE